MFDLKQALFEWREQMLAAGIRAPAPLDELESHLREEIEQQIKSGTHEAEAFNSAVLKIGPGCVLKNEFKKANTKYAPLQIVGLTVGWLMAGCALLYTMISLDLHWNLFNFHDEWDGETIKIIAEMLVVGTGFWFLAKTSQDRASRIVSLLVCLFLAGYALCVVLPPETLTQHVHTTGSGRSTDPTTGALISLMIQNALSRHAPSPLWYRGGLTLLFFVPGIFCVWREWWQVAQTRHSRL